MLVKRFAEAQPYEAPNHWGVTGLRLQGFEEGGPQHQWLGLSQFLPGGGAGPDASPLEKIYMVLDGEMTVECEGRTVVLGPFDSCTIGAGVERRIENRSNHVCRMIVVMPYPQGAKP